MGAGIPVLTSAQVGVPLISVQKVTVPIRPESEHWPGLLLRAPRMASPKSNGEYLRLVGKLSRVGLLQLRQVLQLPADARQLLQVRDT